MITQYDDNYSTISADIQNIVANNIGLMDEYVLCQTGQYEWTALYKTVGLDNTKQVKIKRNTQTGFNNVYEVTRTNYNGDFGANITNEYYTYSNLGYGKSLDLPVYDGVTSWGMCIITTVLMFAILFKGVLFKCLRRRR